MQLSYKKQSSYKSKFIILSLILIAAQSFLSILQMKTRKIGSTPITAEAILAYSSYYKENPAYALLSDYILMDKYYASNLKLPREIIVKEAKKPEYNRLSTGSRIFIAENNIIRQQIEDAVKAAVVISKDLAYKHAKGLLQIRNGAKAAVKYSDLQIEFPEDAMRQYHSDHKLELKSDRIVRGRIVIINSSKISREGFENLIKAGRSLENIQDEYNAQIESITWTNHHAKHIQYPFLNNEPKTRAKFYSTNDGNTIYLKIDSVEPAQYLHNYEDAKSKINLAMRKQYVLDNAKHMKLNWTKLTDQNIRKNPDSFILFSTKKGNIGHYETDDTIVLIKTDEVKNFEPTEKQILESKSLLTKYFQSLSMKAFQDALFYEYQNDLYAFINKNGV